MYFKGFAIQNGLLKRTLKKGNFEADLESLKKRTGNFKEFYFLLRAI